MANMLRGQWTFQAIGPGQWIVVDFRGYPFGYPERLVFESMSLAQQTADDLSCRRLTVSPR